MSKSRLGKGLGAIFERNVTFVDEKQNEKVKPKQKEIAEKQKKSQKETTAKVVEPAKKKAVAKKPETKKVETTTKKAATKTTKKVETPKVENPKTATPKKETVIPTVVVEENIENMVVMINLKEIITNPYQPRKDFDEKEISELSESIKQHGVIQPIILKKNVKGYILVAGERRFRACKLAGVKEVPAIVRDFSEREMAEVALIENIQRKDLNILEEALAYEQLMQNHEFTQQKLADNLGKSRSHVSNALRLLKLPYIVKEMLRHQKIEFGHAKVLLGIEDEDLLVNLAKKVDEEEMSVRALERIVEKIKSAQPSARKPKAEADMYVRHLQDFLCRKLGTRVVVSKKASQKKGKVTFEFMSEDDLNRILEILNLVEEI